MRLSVRQPRVGQFSVPKHVFVRPVRRGYLVLGSGENQSLFGTYQSNVFQTMLSTVPEVAMDADLCCGELL